MKYAFIIEAFNKHRSLFGIEMKTSEVTLEYRGEEQEKIANTFTIGLVFIHISFTVFTN